MKTFDNAFEEFFKTFAPTVSCGRQRDQYQLYQNHIKRFIGDEQLSSLNHHKVLVPIRVLENLGKTRTSTMVRHLIGGVFDYCLFNDYCVNNPMYIVKKASKSHRFTHHRFVNSVYLPEFFYEIKQLIDMKHWVALCVIAYTACRSGEAFGMRWSELDLKTKEWKVPAPRMKTKIEHTFFLSDSPVNILKEWKLNCDSKEFVFPSIKNPDRPVSGTVVRKAITKSKFGKKQTMHGFRHVFATTCYESNLWSDDSVELCIAHTTPSSRHFYTSKKFYNFARHNAERRRLVEWYSDVVEQWLNTSVENLTIMEI